MKMHVSVVKVAAGTEFYPEKQQKRSFKRFLVKHATSVCPLRADEKSCISTRAFIAVREA